jgi:hypothetical protein
MVNDPRVDLAQQKGVSMANDPRVDLAQQGGNLTAVTDTAFLDEVESGDDQPTWYDSFAAGFASSNTIIEVGRAITTSNPVFTPEDSYNILNDIYDDASPLAPFRKLMETDAGAADVLLTAQSRAEAEHLAGQIEDKYRRLSLAMDSPVAGIVGMLSGGLLDVSLLVPASAALNVMKIGVNTGRSARLVAASRMAMAGAGDAAIFGTAESISDPTVDFGDLMTYTAAGAVIGGALGGVLPPRFVGVNVNRGGFVHIDDTADAWQEAASRMSSSHVMPKSTGAAVPEGAEAAETAVRMGSDKITKASSPIGSDRLSPVGRAQTMSKVSQASLAPKGYTSADEAYTLFNRVLPNRATNEAELLGEARAANAYDINDELIGVFRKHEPEIHTAYRDARKALDRAWGWRGGKMFGSDVKLPGWRLSDREFAHAVDNYRHATFHEDDTSVIWGGISDLTDAEKTRLLPFVEKAAAARDRQAGEFEKMILDRGLATKADFPTTEDGVQIPYSPQFINMEAASMDRTGLKDMFRMFYSREPMDDWLIDRGFIEGVEETTSDGSKMVRGATKFQKLDPETKQEALADWTRYMQGQAEAKVLQAANEATDMAKMARKTAMSLVVTKMANKVRRLRELRTTYADRYTSTTADIAKKEASPKFVPSETHTQRHKTAERSYRLWRRTEEILTTAEEELEFVVSRRHVVEDIQEYINRYSRNTPQIKNLNRKAKAKTGKAERLTTSVENETVANKVDFETRLNNMVDDLLDPMHIRGGGWVSDSVPQRLLPKQFDISTAEMRYHPLVQKFYNWDFDHAYQNYERQVLPRIAMHDALQGRSLREQAAAVNKKFNVDIKNAEVAGQQKEANLLKKYQNQFASDLHEIERRFLGGPDPASPGARYWSTQIKRFNVVSMLGSVALTLPGDLMMSDIAHGRLGKGLQAVWTAPSMKAALRDLEKGGQHTMRAVLSMSEDARNMDMRQLRFADLDNYGNMHAIGGPGSLYREASRMLDATTEAGVTAMMRVNLMRPWNLFMRAGNGHLFMSDTLKNMARYSKLDSKVLSSYARRGIDADDATAIAQLHAKHGSIRAGRFNMPNWAAMEADNPVAMSKFHRMVRGAIRDAIPEAELGHSPLLAGTPIGSIWLQFLSFPMMAKQIVGRLGEVRNAKAPLFMGAALQGLLYAALGDWARHALRGEGAEWMKQAETPEGWSQILYTSYIRSPMASGFQGPLGELITKGVSEPLNKILEQQGLAPVVPGSGKFKDANALSLLAGPTGSQVRRAYGLVNTGLGAITDEEQQESAIRQGIHAAPFASHPIFRALEAWHYGE